MKKHGFVLGLLALGACIALITACDLPTGSKSGEKAITAFVIGSKQAEINDTVITITLPHGTNRASLTPLITVSEKASVNPASGVARDFSDSVTYTVTAEDGTTKDYIVIVTIAGGDPNDTLSGTITINPSSGVTTGAMLTAVYSGSETVTYQWNKNDSPISAADGGTLQNFTPSEAGSYTVTVNAAGYRSKTSAAVTVVGVTIPPLSGTITISPNTGVTTGTTLTAVYSGSETVTYQWNKNDSPISAADGGTLQNFTPSEAGSYTVTVNAAGYRSKTSAAVTVTGATIPPLSGTITISGTISTSDGGGILTNATVQLKQYGSNVGSTVYPDSYGHYAITGVPAGADYTIEVTLSGYVTGTITSFSVSGNVVGKNLQLAKITVPTYTISGTISTNDGGGTLTSATVQLKQGSSNVGSAVYPASNGDYTITGVSAGTDYIIEVALSGYVTGTISSFSVSGNVSGKNLTMQVEEGIIKKVFTGGKHTFVLSSDNKVYATGKNNTGELGLGDTTNRTSFTEVTGLSGKNITTISVNTNDTVALSSDGKVYATGYNHAGQLGLGDTTRRTSFTEVTGLSGKNITAIEVSGMRTFALSSDGKVYATGNNDSGTLGLGDTTGRTNFTEVTGLSGKNIIAISGGDFFTVALSSDGKVYATGSIKEQFGLGDTSYKTNFTEVTGLSGKNITAISVGGGEGSTEPYTVALSSDGKVYAIGYNTVGQLGLGDTINRTSFTEVTGLSGKNITAISVGGACIFALSSDNKVYATGHNIVGALGLGDTTNRTSFTEVTGLSDKNITVISAGPTHTVALSSDGKVYATGYNDTGALGLGDTTYRISFTEVTLP